MNRISILTLTFSLFANVLHAQNLVPNGDFEQYTTCPTFTSQMSHCVGWSSYTLATPDYFSCNNAVVGVPNNTLGSQAAASGNAYAGFFTYSSGQAGSYKEYISSQINTLAIGRTYRVSMSVSLADSSLYASDDIGVYFFRNAPIYIIASTNVLTVTPQVSYASYGAITNKTGWVRVTSVFIADSAYDHIVIGGFKPYSSMTLTTVSPPTTYNASYYYIDSVVLVKDDSIEINYSNSHLCAGDTFTVPYTILSQGRFAINNTFTLQLSNASGSFTVPLNIGSIASKVSGSIKGTIPDTVSEGSGYKLRLVSSNISDTSNATLQNITIGVRPVKPIATGTSSVLCERDTLKLRSSTTTPGVSYEWVGPNGFNSGNQNVNIVNTSVAATGNYIVAAYSNGCPSTDTVSILVKPLPVSSLSPTSNSSACSNDTLKITTANTLTGSIYNWTGPNGFSSSSQNPIIIHPATTYTGKFYVTASLNGCSVNDSVSIIVNASPGLPVAGSNSPVCPGDTLHLFSASLPNVAYQWAGPGSFAYNIQNPSLINSNSTYAGKYYVTATTPAGCYSKDSTLVVIQPVTVPPIAGSNNPACIGGLLNLTATAPNAFFWIWSGPNGFNSSTQNATKTNVIAADAGTYTVKVVASNGCVSVASSVNVSVIQGPAVSIYASPKDTICAGNNMALVALPFNLGSNTASYEWYRNNVFTGNTGGSLITPNVNDGDVFYVTMVASGGSCNTAILSNSVKMKVLPAAPPPSVTIQAAPGTTVWSGLNINFTSSNLNNAGSNPGYQWTRNGHNITGATSDHWGATDLNNNDTICLVVTSSAQCATPKTAVSNCIEMKVSTGVDNVSDKNRIEIFPNPNSGQFTISIATHLLPAVLGIYDMQGLKIKEYKLRDINTIIELSDIATGVYYARLTTYDNKNLIIDKVTVTK